MINERNANSVFQAAVNEDQYASQSPEHNRHTLSKATWPHGTNPPQDPTNNQRTMTHVEMWQWHKICV